MKVIIHLGYVLVIALLLVLYLTKEEAQQKGDPKPEVVGQTYDEAPKLDWTYGVDYETLIPMEELLEQDADLKKFIKELESIFRKKDWMRIIEISNPEHYAEQGSFLGNDTAYVYNNISIHPHWEHRVVIKNRLGKPGNKGFDSLNEIKALKLVGRMPEKSYGDTYDYYGYVEKNNGVILAVYFSITTRNNKYELTGGVG